jgi:hypothetical protein
LAHVRAHEAKHFELYLAAEKGTVNGPFETLLFRGSRADFDRTALDLGEKMIDVILNFLANEDVIPASDPRRLEFTEAPCKIGLKPNR